LNRPVGVTASAIVAIIGSLVALLFAGVMLLTLVMPPAQPQPQPPGYTGIAIGSAVMFAVLAATGLWTSIGLFRLRRWARTSMLVFAGSIAVFGLLMLIVVAIMPAQMSAQAGGDAARAARPLLIATFSIPVAIGVWWLFQFNAPSTALAFKSTSPDARPELPLSITLIAWTTLIGGVVCVIPILIGLPAILFGIEIGGWPARVVYAVFGAVSTYIGWGLIKYQERARVLAIGWYALTLAHMAVVSLVPSLRERMLQAQRDIAGAQGQQLVIDDATFLSLTLGLVVLVVVATIWFLVRNKEAFRRHAPTFTPLSPPTQ